MTIHRFLFFLKRAKIIDKKAKLIVIRPLKIGRTNVRDKFQDFQPLWLVHSFVIIVKHCIVDWSNAVYLYPTLLHNI